jgi:hypothetical protein
MEGGALPAEVNFFLRHTLQKPVIAFERRKIDTYSFAYRSIVQQSQKYDLVLFITQGVVLCHNKPP